MSLVTELQSWTAQVGMGVPVVAHTPAVQVFGLQVSALQAVVVGAPEHNPPWQVRRVVPFPFPVQATMPQGVASAFSIPAQTLVVVDVGGATPATQVSGVSMQSLFAPVQVPVSDVF